MLLNLLKKFTIALLSVQCFLLNLARRPGNSNFVKGTKHTRRLTFPYSTWPLQSQGMVSHYFYLFHEHAVLIKIQPAEIFHCLETLCRYAGGTKPIARDILWHEVENLY